VLGGLYFEGKGVEKISPAPNNWFEAPHQRVMPLDNTSLV
jgi:hypothetical protein